MQGHWFHTRTYATTTTLTPLTHPPTHPHSHTHTMDDLLDHVGKIQTTQQKMQKGVGTGLDNLSKLLEQAKEAIATGEIMRVHNSRSFCTLLTLLINQLDPSNTTQALQRLQQNANKLYQKEGDGSKQGDDDKAGKDKEFYKIQRKFHGAVNKFSKDIDRVRT